MLFAMKKTIIIFCLALTAGLSALAQTRTWTVTESGWGRIENGISVAGSFPERSIGEMNIPRWRKTPGTLKVDFDKREAVLSLDRKKEKPFILLTESRPFQTRDGWSYVEYEALDARNAGCRFWICTHESGSQRLLILYPFGRPDTIYGYNLTR